MKRDENAATEAKRGYADLHEHLDTLRRENLLLTIDRPVDKDSELHPLVRWQYVGGIEEDARKAFLFTNVVDARGRKYAFPVVVGAFAGNRRIYCLGMDATPEDVQPRWERAIANPIAPQVVESARCQEVVITFVAVNVGALSKPGFDTGIGSASSPLPSPCSASPVSTTS